MFVVGEPSGGVRRAVLRVLLLAVAMLLAVPQARAQFVRFERLGAAQGLGNLAVDAINQDNDGAILVGTEGGLYRYDGAAFHPAVDKALSAKAWIHQILRDRSGRLWLATGEGVFVRDGATTRKAASVRLPDNEISEHSLAEVGSAVVADLDGVITVVGVEPGGSDTPGPLFDKPTRERIPEVDHANFVAADGGSGVLVGCGRRLCRGWGSHVSVLGPADGLPDETWLAALHAPDGTIWARSLRHLAWRRPGQASFSVSDVPGSTQSFFAGHPETLDLAADGEGGVFTVSDKGLVQWDGHRWRAFAHHAGGLPANVAHALFLDQEGSLWVGSEGGGVARSLGLRLWEHWTDDDGLADNTVWSMAQMPDGTTWVATNGGTVELDGRHVHLPGSNCALAVSRHGRLWLAPLGQGLERLDNDAAKPEQIAPLVHDAISAVIDRDDRLWIAGREGLVVIDDADAPASLIKPRVLLGHGQFTLALDGTGGVWAIEQAHLYREAAGGGLSSVRMPANWSYRPTDLAFGRDGSLWVGTETGGVRHLRVENDHALSLPPLMAPDIASDSVFFVHTDHRGWLWVGTDQGIDLVTGSTAVRVDGSDGALSNDLDQDSVMEGADGSMWFGSSGGLSHLLDPGRFVHHRELHPQVTSVSYGDRIATLNGPLDTPWSPTPLVIRVDDYDFATGPLTFRYRLKGVDEHWSETGAREIRYANVPAGQLVFEVYAVDASHNVTSEPVFVALRIHPPPWRQPWFYALLWLAGAGAIAAAWWLRMGFLMRQRTQLEELVRRRTVEIEAANAKLARQSALEQRRLEEMVASRTAEIEAAREELQRLAMSDALTGLPNRRAILSVLGGWLMAPPASDETVGALLLDVDHFKQLNDRFGHLSGDEILAQYGRRLAAATAGEELAGRYGGEEFLVVLRGHAGQLPDRARAIWAAVSGESYLLGAQRKRVTASAGLALLREGESELSLIERADAALYRAKAGGRHRLELADAGGEPGEPDHLSPGGLSPEFPHLLRRACEAREFTIHYQPVVDVTTTAVISCEALLRWNSETLGCVPPDVFIPAVEAMGLMPDLGAWVLGEACREAASWPMHVGVSVNLSPCQLVDMTVVEQVAHVLRETGLSPARLELEVTESALIHDVEHARAILHELGALGVSIALDDFGTGFSSLSFLNSLPFDRIKIDKSFVRDLGRSERSFTIVRSLASLCRGLGARVTAEGVETELHVDMLVRAGCRELQGYLFSRPCPPTELRKWFRSHITADRAAEMAGSAN